jgi:methyltransferase (TIGR00027 family)
MPEPPIKNVSDTAFAIAYYRALESERAEALFRDPLAVLLVGERGREIAAAMPLPSMTRQVVVIRTYVIDNLIRFAIGQGVDAILNLGAGLDRRPYRMNLPESLLWIEADYPHVIEFKEARLSAEKSCCKLERYKLDLANLSDRRKLLEFVNARTRQMLVLTEGVVSYLSLKEAGSLAEDLRALNNACYWIVEYFSRELIKFRRRRGIGRKMQNAPFKFAPEDSLGFFAEHGWHPKEIRYFAEEAERMHRPLQFTLLQGLSLKIRTLFASSERKASFKRFLGYALLEPGSAKLAHAAPQRSV